MHRFCNIMPYVRCSTLTLCTLTPVCVLMIRQELLNNAIHRATRAEEDAIKYQKQLNKIELEAEKERNAVSRANMVTIAFFI
mgnify:CR=1 FL=1